MLDLGYMRIIAMNLCVSGRAPPNSVVVAYVVKCVCWRKWVGRCVWKKLQHVATGTEMCCYG